MVFSKSGAIIIGDKKDFYVSSCKHPRGSKYILDAEKINTESFHFAAHIEGENRLLSVITLSFGSAR